MSTAGLWVGLALAFIEGGLLVACLWPGRALPLGLVAALAWPAGLALSSAAVFLQLVVLESARWPLFEGLLLAGLLAWALSTRRRTRRRLLFARPALASPTTLALVMLAVAAGAALMASLVVAESIPDGYWDAWARINLKARFLARGEDWTWIFHGEAIPHPDYPLLVECSIARLWSFAGALDRRVPLALSLLNWCACLVLVASAVGYLRGGLAAALAGLTCLAKRSDPFWAAAQYADFAQAGLAVAAALMLVVATGRGRRAQRAWPLLGFFTAAAAWCKNEGLAFAALVLLLALGWILTRAVHRRRAWVGLAAGLAPCGAALLVLKLGFAAESRVFAARTRPFLTDLLDGARWEAMCAHLVEFCGREVAGWALLVLLAGAWLVPARPGQRRSFLPLLSAGLLAALFLAVMVTTHENLEWHLETAFDRLVLQLWPLALFGLAAAVPARA